MPFRNYLPVHTSLLARSRGPSFRLPYMIDVETMDDSVVLFPPLGTTFVTPLQRSQSSIVQRKNHRSISFVTSDPISSYNCADIIQTYISLNFPNKSQRQKSPTFAVQQEFRNSHKRFRPASSRLLLSINPILSICPDPPISHTRSRNKHSISLSPSPLSLPLFLSSSFSRAFARTFSPSLSRSQSRFFLSVLTIISF